MAPAHWERSLCPAAAEPPARLPACPPACPFGASVGESPVVGAEPEVVPATPSSSPSPSPLPFTLCLPSRLRHPPAPHTQDENALPGTTQQRLDGFGHGPAVAHPQHHLQPLRLGESLRAAAPLASVTAAPLCLSGSRRTPLRTRRASSQALAPGLPRTPHTLILTRARQRLPDVGVFAPITWSTHPPHSAGSEISRSMLPMA